MHAWVKSKRLDVSRDLCGAPVFLKTQGSVPEFCPLIESDAALFLITSSLLLIISWSGPSICLSICTCSASAQSLVRALVQLDCGGVRVAVRLIDD
jgi:hypothetical protein